MELAKPHFPQFYPLVPTFRPQTCSCGQLVALAGERRGYGGNGWLAGPLAEAGKPQVLGKLNNKL